MYFFGQEIGIKSDIIKPYITLFRLHLQSFTLPVFPELSVELARQQFKALGLCNFLRELSIPSSKNDIEFVKLLAQEYPHFKFIRHFTLQRPVVSSISMLMEAIKSEKRTSIRSITINESFLPPSFYSEILSKHSLISFGFTNYNRIISKVLTMQSNIFNAIINRAPSLSQSGFFNRNTGESDQNENPGNASSHTLNNGHDLSTYLTENGYLDFVTHPNFSRLRSLSLSGNHTLNIETLLPYFRCLFSLDLSYCELDIPQTIRLIKPFDFPNLRFLNLSGNKGNNTISSRILTFPNRLHKFYARDVKWNVDIFSEIFKLCLNSFPRQEIDQVNDQERENNEIEKVNQVQQQNISKSSKNDWIIDFSDAHFAFDFSNLPFLDSDSIQNLNNNKITHFYWNNNPISQLFLSLFSNSETLISLSLCNCVNTENMVLICNFMATLHHLQILNMKGGSNNSLPDIKPIIDVLKQLSHIQKVNFSGNNLTYDSLNSLLECVLTCSNIQFIGFDNSSISLDPSNESELFYLDFFEQFITKLEKRESPIYTSWPDSDISHMLELSDNSENMASYLQRIEILKYRVNELTYSLKDRQVYSPPTNIYEKQFDVFYQALDDPFPKYINKEMLNTFYFYPIPNKAASEEIDNGESNEGATPKTEVPKEEILENESEKDSNNSVSNQILTDNFEEIQEERNNNQNIEPSYITHHPIEIPWDIQQEISLSQQNQTSMSISNNDSSTYDPISILQEMLQNIQEESHSRTFVKRFDSIQHLFPLPSIPKINNGGIIGDLEKTYSLQKLVFQIRRQ